MNFTHDEVRPLSAVMTKSITTAPSGHRRERSVLISVNDLAPPIDEYREKQRPSTTGFNRRNRRRAKPGTKVKAGGSVFDPDKEAKVLERINRTPSDDMSGEIRLLMGKSWMRPNSDK